MCEHFWWDDNTAVPCGAVATHEFDEQLVCAFHCNELWNEAAWLAHWDAKELVNNVS